MVTSRIWFTATQKVELWERWKQGHSISAISRALERRNKTGVQRIVALHGRLRWRVAQKLALQWLPQQVAGWLKRQYPPRWYVDAIPYFLSTMALHRRTPVLSPGSGNGQKMRARIVDHLMMNWQQNGFAAPLFDPVIPSITPALMPR